MNESKIRDEETRYCSSLKTYKALFHLFQFGYILRDIISLVIASKPTTDTSTSIGHMHATKGVFLVTTAFLPVKRDFSMNTYS